MALVFKPDKKKPGKPKAPAKARSKGDKDLDAKAQKFNKSPKMQAARKRGVADLKKMGVKNPPKYSPKKK